MTAEKVPARVLAILGGTGKEGAGLAMRWALAGYDVIIGSRSEDKAKTRAAEMNAELGGDWLRGLSNAAAAEAADWIVLSVPYGAHRATLESVAEWCRGKVVIDLTVPLRPPEIAAVNLPAGAAAALEAQAILGADALVAAAFQNVSAVKLRQLDREVDCDVLVCADAIEAKQAAMRLAEAAGMRGLDAGPLKNAVAVESLTPLLLHINRTYGTAGAGIRITGLED